MLFNSYQFAAFFAVVFALHWTLRGRARLWMLLAASYLFYGAFDWRFLGLLVVSTATDYVAGRYIALSATQSQKRVLLWTAVVINLAILGTFKYFDFFYDSAAALLEALGLGVPELSLRVVLPVGISFYTFQSMSYTIDVYRQKVDAEPDPLVFACYVAFFPQLAAGPIERASKLIPQLRNLPARPDPKDLWLGVDLVLLGLFRKVAIADVMIPVVFEAFVERREFFGQTIDVQNGWVTLLCGAIAFGVQVYADFAGYSTIARGLGKMLGVDLSINFLRPARARSQAEFWQRWHVTLMNWFRDYVYYPLWRRRWRRLPLRRKSRLAFALLVTFTLSGLWHGANWTFVLWGFLLGLMLLVDWSIRDWWRRSVVRTRQPAAEAIRFGTADETAFEASAEPSAKPPTHDPLASGSDHSDSSGHHSSHERGSAVFPSKLIGAVQLVVTVGSLILVSVLEAVPTVGDAVHIWTGIFGAREGPIHFHLVAAVFYAVVALYLSDQHEIHLEQVERAQRSSQEPWAARERVIPWWSWGVRTAILVAGIVVFAPNEGQPFYYFQF
ncbi:MAG: hypothetical protein KatS3mg008_0533 [Acidimicrobiales bacterium]|nr:MAG: hypothetical protein KatS3mg008_0533 [Acidimicrobiales bacterium]